MNSLKRARLLSSKRQIDVYNAIGIWPGRLSLIENGLIKPRKEEIVSLAGIYGVTFTELLEDTRWSNIIPENEGRDWTFTNPNSKRKENSL